MSEWAIEIDDLTKEFRLSHAGAGSLKTQVMARVRSGMRATPSLETRRVLDGVSVKIARGETVGLIGRNGSGKSTLLGMLARIYTLSAGRILIRGRVVALLELGAGFHPELTGIENVFFNGAILGLTQKQIADRFESIVAFAELENSIDAPVRNYSSGMLLRLGFSVAVHMDSEIILIDEALAVGDEAFQHKCFDKIKEFQQSGKTIVVVSHELDHLERVATRVLWLKHGKIVMDGPTPDVLAAYVREMNETDESP